ncbi:MAG: hypothetical protein M3Y56_09240 [Armatimonadota bacterium]|nr:hypothetical protein [Armatimonadota bacterium]
MAYKLDCYFTIEADRGADNHIPFFDMTVVPDREDVESVDALVAVLRQQLPAVTVVRSRDNSSVIHLIETSLEQDNSYLLDRKFDFTYSGVLGGLPNEIGNRFDGRLREPRGGAFGEDYNDWDTKVHIISNNTSIRDILTDHVPLTGYWRVLWIAATRPFGGKRETWLQYHGVPETRSFFYWNAASHPSGTFADGELAYATEPDSQELNDQAMGFIDARIKETKPLQVRWAMLFLGKNKVQQGIPTLLKYLDYQYTTCPLPLDEFPALHAMVDMGKPGADAAMGAVSSETSDLRLQLLCRAVIGVRGLPEARKLIAATILRIPDRAQQKRVRAALATVITQMEVEGVPAGPQSAATHGY